MKEITREIINTVTSYVSEDGETFSSETACLSHEWKKQATVVWFVYKRDGGRTREAYSTEALALKAVGSSQAYTIEPIHLDQRFWKKAR